MHLIRALAVLFLLLAGALPAHAEGAIAGRRVALVVGNASYRNVDRLANSANDARLIAATLQSLGFTLVGGGAQIDLDRARLAQAVQDFGHALAGADVGLFYYSGHGLQVQGVNWLVPVDANPTRPQDLDFQMVDADLVLRQMDGAGTRLNLVLLDACRNNPFATRGLRAMQAGLAEMRAPEGTLISYATQPGNVAADGTGPNSPYTTALASAMRQPGLDVFRLFNQVGLAVKRGTGGAQQPWVSTSPIDGDFSFAGSAPPPPAAPPTQVAGLAVPPPPPPAPADPLASLRALATAAPCAILDVKESGGRPLLTGFAAAGAAWDALLKQVQAGSRGIRPANEVVLLPPFACDVVAAVGPLVRRSRAEAPAPLVSLPAGAVTGRLPVTLSTHETGSVQLDIFLPDGTVRHAATRETNGPARMDIALTNPQADGKRVVLALAGDLPASLTTRPRGEPAAAYLAILGPALASASGVRADLAVFDQRAALPNPLPGLPAPPPRPGRCTAVLERAQLGETLSETDRAYLRANCR